MTEANSDDRLLDEAIDLMIRFQNDPDNPVTMELIRAWRGRGEQHENVWKRVSTVHGASGKILNEKRRIERQDSLSLSRRKLMIGWFTAFAAGGAVWSWGPRMLVRARADYITAKSEIRKIALPDGSTATLGPESAIALDFQSDRRNIALLEGMSFFEVASDAKRQFCVECGNLATTALGAAFEMSHDAGLLTVSVDHGLVDVRASGSVLQTGEELGENQWITFDPSSGSVDRGQRASGQVAAWRDNLIIAEKEAVSALVARIGRWIPGKIIIADPSIGGWRVSGIFDLSDPIRALQAAVLPAGARVRHISSLVTLISPI